MVLSWLRSLFGRPKVAGPPEPVRLFGPADSPIAKDGVLADGNGWRIEAREAGAVELFEVADPGVEQCRLAYRANIRTDALEGGAYLEMWCRLPGEGEFFSKGVDRKVKGTTTWASHEVPFWLEAGQRPDLVRLNVAFVGPGTLWVRDVELQKTPLR